MALKMTFIHVFVVVALLLPVFFNTLLFILFALVGVVLIPILTIIIASRLKILPNHTTRTVIVAFIASGFLGGILTSSIQNDGLALTITIATVYVAYFFQIKEFYK